MFSSPGAVAIQLGPLSIRWYGILMATAIGVGFWLAHREARAEKLPADDILRVAQWAVMAGLIGARLYEVIFNWDYYGQYPAKIIAVWEGGLAIHGGLIVGPLVGVYLARRWRVPIWRSLDVAAPSIAIGQAIGRWGNFFNEEAFGRPTDLPWKLYISPAAPTAAVRPGRLLSSHVPLRIAVGSGHLPDARAVAQTEASRPTGRAVLLLRRPLLRGPLRDRVAPARQLLARRFPGAAARKRAGFVVAAVGLAVVSRRRAPV